MNLHKFTSFAYVRTGEKYENCEFSSSFILHQRSTLLVMSECSCISFHPLLLCSLNFSGVPTKRLKCVTFELLNLNFQSFFSDSF